MRDVHDEIPYVTPPGIHGAEARHSVAIVGAGPIGLALAVDLATRCVPSVILDDNNRVSTGSRAICWAKRTLEIFDRLGVGQGMVDQGVTWKIGRLYRGSEELWSFDLLPEDGHRMPAFVNLQQYHVEQSLIARAADFPDLIDFRVLNRVTGVAETEGGAARLDIQTPDGPYTLDADHVVACDGAASGTRSALGLDLAGQRFEERFLIADIEMTAAFPPERWFWFEPPFHPGQSALLHKQPDNIYRIDLQLGPDADPDAEARPEVVIPRIERIVGHRDFRLDWVSVYSFQCRRLDRFVHGPVIFAGDSAHVVSPFGARGGNGGIQDVDGLGWRLAEISAGAPADILEDYDRERGEAADENILNSARATRFMSPDDGAERVFRDAVLDLAGHEAFARRLVNSGRLSQPCRYAMPDAPDVPELPEGSRPGAPAPDAPLDDAEGAEGKWLLDRLGSGFTVLGIGAAVQAVGVAEAIQIDTPPGHIADRYLGTADQAVYLIRPDQHIAGRWRTFDADAIAAEIARHRRRRS